MHFTVELWNKQLILLERLVIVWTYFCMVAWAGLLIYPKTPLRHLQLGKGQNDNWAKISMVW